MTIGEQMAAARERERAVRLILSVERCLCPFTPGAGLPGWTPDFSLGVDGRPKDYCPFGIAEYVQTQPVQRRTERFYDK